MARHPSGEYRLRVMILARTLAPSATNGEEVESWPNEGPAYYAKTESLNAGEQIGQGVSQSAGLRKVRVRGRAIPVRAVDRVKFVTSGELYNVTAVFRDFDFDDTVLTIERAAQQSAEQ